MSQREHKHNYNSLVRLVYLFMPHIVIFLHEFFSAVQHLKALLSYYWNAAERSILSVHPIIATHTSMGTVKRMILKYLLDFKNLINIGCATLSHLSMRYITVYNLSINSNYRILAAEINYRFTEA